MNSSALRQGNNFGFQRDLIKTNGLLQSLVTDMRYHCEVYKLSLRSINKILKQLQQEATTDRRIFATTRLKYTARSNYQRDIALVSQKQALEKINSVLRKTRTFINGYSLLEKADIQVEVPEMLSKKDQDNNNGSVLFQSTQPLGHPSEKTEESLSQKGVLFDEEKVSNVIKRSSGDALPDSVMEKSPASPEKISTSCQIEVDVIQKEIQHWETNSFFRENPPPNICKLVKLDKPIGEAKGENPFILSDSNLLKPKRKSRFDSCSRLERESQCPNSSSCYASTAASKTLLSDKPKKFSVTDDEKKCDQEIRTPRSSLDDKHSKIATVQTRRNVKYDSSTWKYNRQNNYVNRHQQRENPKKFVSNQQSYNRTGGRKTVQRKNSIYSAFDHDFHYAQHPQHEGKVRRVDIDSPGNEIMCGNLKSRQVHRPGSGHDSNSSCRSKCSSFDYYQFSSPSSSKGFQETNMSEFDKQDKLSNTVILTSTTKEIEVETPLQNSKVTTTLIPHDNTSPVFLEDPRLRKRRLMAEQQLNKTTI